MAAEFFKNSDLNFGQKSRWLQLISMTIIMVLDLKMSQFQKKQMSCQKKQMAAKFFKNSDKNFGQKSRWLQLILIYDINKGVPISKKANVMSEKVDVSRILQEF